MSEKELKPARVRRGKASSLAPPVETAADVGTRPPAPSRKARAPKAGCERAAAPSGPPDVAGAPKVASTPKVASAPRAGAASKATAPRPLGRPPLLDDPRAEILQQAARLFAEKGFSSGSLAELARAMNYSKGAIYNYFSSKQEIYDAIIIFTLTGLYEASAIAVNRQDPPVDQLRQYMVAHARFLADNYDCFVTMLVGFSGMANSELKDDALALRDAHEGLLREIIADGVADGSFRAVGEAMTGRAVLSLLSWMVRWFRPGRGKSAEEVALEYHDLLVRGLLPG
ncbi:TetR/AcrR family transcriptional regulator [Xanthobacter variabilis]|uniref:TetR/AcrR family transcriptional regulator n=1 Tax=Xanthobacter variabilis TaxID=3119932 RepID=UPI00374FC86E